MSIIVWYVQARPLTLNICLVILTSTGVVSNRMELDVFGSHRPPVLDTCTGLEVSADIKAFAHIGRAAFYWPSIFYTQSSQADLIPCFPSAPTCIKTLPPQLHHRHALLCTCDPNIHRVFTMVLVCLLVVLDGQLVMPWIVYSSVCHEKCF